MRFFTNKLVIMNSSQSWPNILGKLLAKSDLSRAEASWAMGQIMSGDSSEAQIGAFMMALRSKGESVEELAGLVDVMLQHSVILDTGSDAVDIVGTGGDMVGIDAANLALVNQVLGEGEVSALVTGGDSSFELRVQESVFAGVWRVVCSVNGVEAIASMTGASLMPLMVTVTSWATVPPWPSEMRTV